MRSPPTCSSMNLMVSVAKSGSSSCARMASYSSHWSTLALRRAVGTVARRGGGVGARVIQRWNVRQAPARAGPARRQDKRGCAGERAWCAATVRSTPAPAAAAARLPGRSSSSSGLSASATPRHEGGTYEGRHSRAALQRIVVVVVLARHLALEQLGQRLVAVHGGDQARVHQALRRGGRRGLAGV